VEEGVLCVQNGNRSNLTPAKYGFPTDRLELDRSTLDIRTISYKDRSTGGADSVKEPHRAIAVAFTSRMRPCSR
jgi:hypothetical protein